MKKLIITIAAVFLIAGCATPLETIKGSPARFVGRDVMVSATVTLEAAIPFMDYSIYRVNDDTDEMFLFTDKKYSIGDKIYIPVHVVGVTEDSAGSAAENAAQQMSDYLIVNKILDKSKALTFSKKIVKIISTLGSITEGSYFLIAK